MKHVLSHELYAYWNAQRGMHVLPDRADIEPGAIRGVLADTFILATSASAGPRFRLAGTRLCALFCRELKGENFASLWTPDGCSEMHARIATVAEDSIGLVGNARAQNADGALVDLELLLLPLGLRGIAGKRIIGTLAPFEAPYWLGVTPITNLTLGSFRHLDAALDRDAPVFVSGAVAAEVLCAEKPGHAPTQARTPSLPSVKRAQHGLKVYDGGLLERTGS